MPIPVFMNADPGVHDHPIRLFTMSRSACSPSSEIRTSALSAVNSCGEWVVATT
jgi:hypothetical protein